MNPNVASDPTSALLGALFTGGLIIVLMYLAVVFICVYVGYRIIKAAVRNGVIEALNKTGVADAAAGRSNIQGYPPAQHYAAPAAQSVQESTYAGQGR